MSTPGRAEQMRALSQLVTAPLTPAAIFLVVTVNRGAEPEGAVRALSADLANLVRAVGFRDLEGQLSCIAGFGSEVWDRLFGEPRPARVASVPRVPRRWPARDRNPRRYLVSHSRAANGSVL